MILKFISCFIIESDPFKPQNAQLELIRVRDQDNHVASSYIKIWYGMTDGRTDTDSRTKLALLKFKLSFHYARLQGFYISISIIM